MNYVDWCDFVLETLIQITQSSLTARSRGVDMLHLAHALFGNDFARHPGYSGIGKALHNLKNIGLLKTDENYSWWNVTSTGKEYALERTSLWHEICQVKLKPEQEQLIRLVNQRSPQSASDYAWLEKITYEPLLAELEWPQGIHLLGPVAEELTELGLLDSYVVLGQYVQIQSTFKGLVWETKRGFTLESRFIDNLVAEWETTSVEFKQELYLQSVEQKAEFIKDILSLANTQASGRRWMIIGFHNKTHDYYGPPNPNLSRDNFERLIAEYTNPPVDIRYNVVEYRKGPVGKLEVVRDRKKIPYRVAKPLGEKLKGDKHRISVGQIFVRHGSQVQEPTDAELQALIEESDRARSMQE